MTTKAVLIHSTQEAEQFIQQYGALAGKEYRLFSTSTAVDGFLDQTYSIHSDCLSRYITHDEVVEHIRVSESAVDALVGALDEKISPELNRQAGCRGVRFFRSLYSYCGFIRFNACLNFLVCLQRALDRHEISELRYYEYSFREGIPSEKTVTRLLASALQERIARSAIPMWEKGMIPGLRNRLFGTGISLVRNLRHLGRLIHPGFWGQLLLRCRAIMRSVTSSAHRPGVFLYDPLKTLSSYFTELKACNVFSEDLVTRCKAPESGKREKIRFDLDIAGEDRFGIRQLLLHDLESDWNNNDYLGALSVFSMLVQKHDIRLGSWGVPPVSGLHALLFESLLARGIPVLGHQHGGPYIGDQKNYTVDFMDFSRCSYYISYGFTKEDFRRAYPQAHESSVEIFAQRSLSANTRPRHARKPKEMVDILFPITNTISMFEGGMKRDKPDFIMEKQVALLRHLDSKKEFKIVIKPFMRSNLDNLCVLSHLNGCKHVKVVGNLSFSEALSHYGARCVVIDHISSPLYESLGEDLEILVWAGKAAPMEEAALEMLKKRVYYLETEREMLDHIDLFLKGELLAKRDQSYYNHYICNKAMDVRSEIGLLERLVRGREGTYPDASERGGGRRHDKAGLDS